jgi:hypothetical protein
MAAELVRQINKGIWQVKRAKRQVGIEISQVMITFWQVRRFLLKKGIEIANPD